MQTWYESIAFNGNKVLTMDKELDTAWYNELQACSKAFFDYVNGRLAQLCATGSEDASGAEAYFSAMQGGVAATSAPVEEKVEVKVEAKVEAKVEVVEEKPEPVVAQ